MKIYGNKANIRILIMIPRFIHEQLIDNCDILVEKLKEFEKIKAQNNMELKKFKTSFL